MLRLFWYYCLFLVLLRLLRMLQHFWVNQPQSYYQRQTKRQAAFTPTHIPKNPLIAARHLLQVQEGASTEQIRAAYQGLIRQYHPDKVAHLGADLQELASRRTQEINAAYVLLKQHAITSIDGHR